MSLVSGWFKMLIDEEVDLVTTVVVTVVGEPALVALNSASSAGITMKRRLEIYEKINTYHCFSFLV